MLKNAESERGKTEEKPKKRILIVEDNERIGETMEWFCGIQLGFVVAWVKTRRNASRHINMKGPWDCVILDGCLEGLEPDTLYLIPVIKATSPNCVIIANSNDLHVSDRLMAEGCHLRFPSKDDFNQFFRKFCEEKGWT